MCPEPITRVTRFLPISLFILLCLPLRLFAQAGVAGIVTDDTGGALPGVQVTLSGEVVMGQRMAVTDNSGSSASRCRRRVRFS